MCCDRDGKFVVGYSAATGWWVGQIVGDGGVANNMAGREISLRRATIMRTEIAEYSGNMTILVGNVPEFDSAEEALAQISKSH